MKQFIDWLFNRKKVSYKLLILSNKNEYLMFYIGNRIYYLLSNGDFRSGNSVINTPHPPWTIVEI